MSIRHNMTVLLGLVAIVAVMTTGTVQAQTPAAYAEVTTSNPHLYVSAEGQDADNQFAQGNIIEVIIQDDSIGDTDEGEAEPAVTINGADLRMLQTANGDWRAYFAQADAIATIDAMNGELDYGEYCSENAASTTSTLELSDTNGVYFPPGSVDANCSVNGSDDMENYHPLIRETRALTDYNPSGDTIGQLGLSDTNLWPFIQVFDFAPESNVNIVYNKGGSQETVTLEFGDPSESHMLDRTKYPQGAHVLVTIEDFALNIDPTDEDTWAFNTVTKAAYYNLFDEYGNAVNIMNADITDYGGSAGIGERIVIDRNPQGGAPLLDCQVTADFGIQYDASMDYLMSNDDSNGACVPTDNIPNDSAAHVIFTADAFVIGFVEDGSNNNRFINWADDQRSNLVVRDDAQRNSIFVIDYNDPGAISGVVGHFFAELTLGDAGATWNSGERISITVTDEDVNTNPLAENDLTVANPNSKMIPSIRIGSPITLAGASGDVVWYDLPGGEVQQTWTSADKEVESLSDRLRLSEPSAKEVVTGNSKIVIYDWKAPTFDDGVTTLFNWNFDSISHADVTDVILTQYDNHSNNQRIASGSSGLEDITSMNVAIEALGDRVDLVIMMENTNLNHVYGDITLVADFFTFGQTPEGDRINNAIYRIEVEEVTPDNSNFAGSVEYVMLNQINYDNPATYTSLRTIDVDASIIVHEDFTDEDSVRINYFDLGADGVATQIAVQQEAPTHSGVVSFDADNYKIADTVTITLEDADLNVDNDVVDIYTFDTSGNHPDMIGDSGAFILDVTFDDEPWTAANCNGDVPGFASTGFTLMETARNSGIFTGDFQVPSVYCQSSTDSAVSVTGTDIKVYYQDFRDAFGEEIEVGASAAIRANTGTVSLDRTVYPVPFDPAEYGTATDDSLADYDVSGDLGVHIRVNDPDFDVSASGEDKIVNASAYLTVKIIRGAEDVTINLGSTDILEVAPDAGIFEFSFVLAYNDGPNNQLLAGDVLLVEYRDPIDAGGEENTVTDSSTFDLRTGVLQTDSSVYAVGSDMILTLIELDFDLDNDGAEIYPLDLIEWDSDAGTLGMGDNTDSVRQGSAAFDPEPNGLRETGDSTGIFQSIIEIPSELDGDRLEKGEVIELEYVDYGPSGADFVGDETDGINLTISTSNFGATVELDQEVYSWTDKVYITIVAPNHNFDSSSVDEIGDTDLYPVNISTRSANLTNYKLVETGPDTGIFTGEVILIGFDHNADGDTTTGTEHTGYDNPQRLTSGTGPTDGYLATSSDDGITVSFEFALDQTVVGSALVSWNMGVIEWLETSYPASGTGVVRVIDPDMNWNSELADNFEIKVYSDSDMTGIDLTVVETNHATGIFEGTVLFTTMGDSSGHRLRVAEGDTIGANYTDNTLPGSGDVLEIGAGTVIERSPPTNNQGNGQTGTTTGNGQTGTNTGNGQTGTNTGNGQTGTNTGNNQNQGQNNNQDNNNQNPQQQPTKTCR